MSWWSWHDTRFFFLSLYSKIACEVIPCDVERIKLHVLLIMTMCALPTLFYWSWLDGSIRSMCYWSWSCVLCQHEIPCAIYIHIYIYTYIYIYIERERERERERDTSIKNTENLIHFKENTILRENKQKCCIIYFWYINLGYWF